MKIIKLFKIFSKKLINFFKNFGGAQAPLGHQVALPLVVVVVVVPWVLEDNEEQNNNKYMNFFIIVDIIFYCDVYVILLRWKLNKTIDIGCFVKWECKINKVVFGGAK